MLVYATNDEEFLERLHIVFERFRQFNITLNPKKCYFGLTEVEFVGHGGHGLSSTKRRGLLLHGEEIQGLGISLASETEATEIFLRAG